MTSCLDKGSAYPSPSACVFQGLGRLGPGRGARGPQKQKQDGSSQPAVAQMEGLGNWGLQRGDQGGLLERGGSLNGKVATGVPGEDRVLRKKGAYGGGGCRQGALGPVGGSGLIENVRKSPPPPNPEEWRREARALLRPMSCSMADWGLWASQPGHPHWAHKGPLLERMGQGNY